MAAFNVIKGWANWDSEHEEIVDSAPTEEEAQAKARALKARDDAQYSVHGNYYIVKPEGESLNNNQYPPTPERNFRGIHASLDVDVLAKTARVLCEEDQPNSDSALQALVGDPDDARSSTFVQFKPNPGTMQLPNPLSPVEGDEIFFAYMIPGAIFQAHDGTEWWIESYASSDEIEITNRWYPRINAVVSINDIRRSIHQWIEPVTQTVPPPPPGVDYGALPVKIVDGPERYGAGDEVTDYKKNDNTGGW